MDGHSSPRRGPSSPARPGGQPKRVKGSSRRQSAPAPSPPLVPSASSATASLANGIGIDEAITPSRSPSSASSPSPSSSSPSPSTRSSSISIPSPSPRPSRGPSILAARLNSSARHNPSSRHPPPPPLYPVSDEEISDPSPASLTSTAVAAVIANATRSPASPSLHSPPPHMPPMSALSSSLREFSDRKSHLTDNKDERKAPSPSAGEWNADDQTRFVITHYNQSDSLTPPRTSHSSSPSHLSAASSPGDTPISSSPVSTSPFPPSPGRSPNLPPLSLPRAIPTAGGANPLLPSFALSSSAPVSSAYLPLEEEEEENCKADMFATQPNSGRFGRLKPQHSSHHLQQSHHQLLSKSREKSKSEGGGISSISSLINPKDPSSPIHETFKRSRRLSQNLLTGDSPRAKQSPSPIDPDHVVYVTNAAETGYAGYKQMASHESLDYHTIHNELLRAELSSLTDFDYILDNVQRWCVTMMIGALIGVIGFISHFAIEHISAIKFSIVAHHLQSDWRIAYAIYSAFNLGLVLLGSILIIFFCPAAGGSGIPEVKGFLNGTAISRAMNVKTFIVKLIASTTAVASSLPVGPEGPMIHMGAMIGGGVSQPRSKTLNITLPWFQKFHTDRDRRDFIAMGAAAGVASAFGAPLGGVLFAIEEASSFWSQMLTWRTFFACMTATFFTNFLLSGSQGEWGIYDFSQVTEFETSSQLNDSYAIWELLPFALMGCISGLTGALFNWSSERLTILRDKHVQNHPRRRLLEVIFLSLLVSSIFFFAPFYFGCQKCPDASHPNPNIDCTGGNMDSTKKAVQFLCPARQYNSIATLMFSTEVGTVRHLFSRGSSGEFPIITLLFFCVTYFALALWSAGAAVAGGLLVPLLIVGAAYGRLFGSLMISAGFSSVDAGVYALIGAASFFSGVTRMTISLSIIMLEITNDLHYLPAIMLTVMMAKWMGDFFTPAIYDGLMELKFVPFLDQEPPIEMDLLVSSDIMSTKVKVVTETPRVKDLIALLRSCEHNGFPVVSAHPLHKPIMNEPLHQRKTGGVPVNLPALSLTAERLAVLHAHTNTHPLPAATFPVPVNTPSVARPAVVAAAAVSPVMKAAASQKSPSVQSFSAPPSVASSSNQQMLTAGESPALGHGSGRVLRGLILRKQLLVLLQAQLWRSHRMIDPLDFRQRMASFDMKHQSAVLDSIERELTIADRDAKLDLRPYMNRSPFSVHYDFHSVFCFRLFRSMGLRHLPVVNDANEVVGIITRKDIVHPIIKMKYDALLGCKEDGYIDFPGLDISSSGDDEDGEDGDGPFSPKFDLPQSRRQRAILKGKKAIMRPGLKAYSYLSPMESSPEIPGTPVYSTPTLLSRPLIGISPREGGHRHSFNWSSRLTTRV